MGYGTEGKRSEDWKKRVCEAFVNGSTRNQLAENFHTTSTEISKTLSENLCIYGSKIGGVHLGNKDQAYATEKQMLSPYPNYSSDNWEEIKNEYYEKRSNSISTKQKDR